LAALAKAGDAINPSMVWQPGAAGLKIYLEIA